jgi:hypothetical protein
MREHPVQTWNRVIGASWRVAPESPRSGAASAIVVLIVLVLLTVACCVVGGALAWRLSHRPPARQSLPVCPAPALVGVTDPHRATLI